MWVRFMKPRGSVGQMGKSASERSGKRAPVAAKRSPSNAVSPPK
jgi:hypothetical protein